LIIAGDCEAPVKLKYNMLPKQIRVHNFFVILQTLYFVSKSKNQMKHVFTIVVVVVEQGNPGHEVVLKCIRKI
jgi:hypothetical protein